MFDTELFGVTAKEFLTSAQALATPMLGFMFLFLLALPLRKLPIIDVSDYKPPAWVLPVFAIGSFFVVVFCVTVALSLAMIPARVSTADFEASYQVVRKVTTDLGQLTGASISVLEYDGASNFRIFVNGYRVFGSSSNCVLSFQCKPVGDRVSEEGFSSLQSLKPSDRSIYNVYRLNSLPHIEDVSGLLAAGRNFIDIQSENTGVGDCSLKVSLRFSAVQQPETTATVSISPDSGAAASQEQALQGDEIFYSGGLPVSDDSGSDEIVPIYKTMRSNGSYRLCQRIRIAFDLQAGQLSNLEMRWNHWVAARRHELTCAASNDGPEACRK